MIADHHYISAIEKTLGHDPFGADPPNLAIFGVARDRELQGKSFVSFLVFASRNLGPSFAPLLKFLIFQLKLYRDSFQRVDFTVFHLSTQLSSHSRQQVFSLLLCQKLCLFEIFFRRIFSHRRHPLNVRWMMVDRFQAYVTVV